MSLVAEPLPRFLLNKCVNRGSFSKVITVLYEKWSWTPKLSASAGADHEQEGSPRE